MGWRRYGLVAALTVVGTLADKLLSGHFPALRSQTHVTWHPSINVAVIQFSMVLTLMVNWGTLVGFVSGLFMMRRTK